MDDKQFDTFLRSAVQELKEKQELLQKKYSIGQFSRWGIDHDKGILEFFHNDERPGLVAEIVDIGSYSITSGTWKWAWSNQSLPEKSRQQAIKLRELEISTDFEIFGREESFKVDVEMAWELTAISVMHLSALGCYRAPSSNGELFTFTALKTMNILN